MPDVLRPSRVRRKLASRMLLEVASCSRARSRLLRSFPAEDGILAREGAHMIARQTAPQPPQPDVSPARRVIHAAAFATAREAAKPSSRELRPGFVYARIAILPVVSAQRLLQRTCK